MALSDRGIGGLGRANIKHSSTYGVLGEDQIRAQLVNIGAELAKANDEIKWLKVRMANWRPRYRQYPGWWDFRTSPQWGHMEISRLRNALYVLYGSRKLISHSEKANSSPSLLEELDDQVAKLQCRMQHGCKSIKQEKQVITEIKEAKLARQRVLADSIAEANMPIHLRSKGDIEDRIQGIVTGMKELKAVDMRYRTKMKNFQRQVERREDEIRRLERKLAVTNK